MLSSACRRRDDTAAVLVGWVHFGEEWTGEIELRGLQVVVAAHVE